MVKVANDPAAQAQQLPSAGPGTVEDGATVESLRRVVEIHQLIPDSQLIVLENCGHLAPLEQPAEVSEAIRSFLTR